MVLNRYSYLPLFCGVAVGVMLWSGMSDAQPTSAESVLQFRRHEVDYESPVGVPLGGFLLTPGIAYTAQYNDNIFLKNTNTTDDFISAYKPSLAIQSNWNRHELYMGLQANKTDYRWNSQKDSFDYGGILSGTYDIAYGTYVDGFLRKDRQSLSRGSEDDIDGTVPIEYDSWAGRVGFTRALSYIQTKVAVFHDNTKREDNLSTAITGDFLTRDRNGLEGTLTYEFFPKNNLFVTLGHTNIDYELVGGSGRIVNKDELKYGLNFNYSDIYTGSLYFGHLRTDYSDVPDTSRDPFVMLNLAWAPTKLTNVGFSIGRTYGDGNISASEKIVTDSTKLLISHQISEFVTGNITGVISDNAYEALNGTPLRDNRVYGGGVNAQYKMSDHLGLKLGYDYRRRNSDNISEEYTNNRILFSLTYMH